MVDTWEGFVHYKPKRGDKNIHPSIINKASGFWEINSRKHRFGKRERKGEKKGERREYKTRTVDDSVDLL